MYIIKTSAGDRDWVADRNLDCSDLDLKKNRDQEWIAIRREIAKLSGTRLVRNRGKHLNPSSFKGANCR